VQSVVKRSPMKNKPKITLVKEFISKKYDLRYNIILNKFEYKLKGENTWLELNENDIFIDLLENEYRVSLSALIALLKSSFIQKFNPFEYYFSSLPKWDKRDYIAELATYIEISEQDTERFNTQFKKMFVRTVASALGIKLNKQAFILVHEKQNSGKSTFLRWLCPKKLSSHYIEDIGFDKDSLIALAENFIINLDELSTLSKKDINHLKSIMSKDEIKTRLPYDKRASVLKRRCSFVGSTNNEEFLSDETGNVRWVCFAINSINWNYTSDFEIDKIWSQAYTLFNEGFEYQLNRDEIIENERANASFIIRTPELELLQKYFAPSIKNSPGAVFMTTTEITNEIRNKAYGVNIFPGQMGKALKILGFSKDSKYNSRFKFSIKGYYVVAKETGLFNNEEDDSVLLPDQIPM